MSELLLHCACGWTKQGRIEWWSWLRLLVHELRHHRKDGLWAQNGISRMSFRSPALTEEGE